MKLLFVCLIAFAMCSDEELFAKFQMEYNRAYPSKREEAKRFQIFKQNLKTIREHNSKEDSTYTLGINKFTDLTYDEFASVYLTSPEHVPEAKNEMGDGSLTPIDWRDKGAVTPMKDQGSCGSCYSFSAVGATEGRTYTEKKTLIDFSEQQCVDCGKPDGNQGCNGGLKEKCFNGYIRMGGLMVQQDYPYTGRAATCAFDIAKAKVNFKNYGHVDTEAKLQQEIQNGPVGVSIYATSSFQMFSGTGVFIDTRCPNTSTNHAVTCVGQGILNGQDYYIIKNSWGTGWGDKGYVKWAANHNNMCTVGSRVYWPTNIQLL